VAISPYNYAGLQANSADFNRIRTSSQNAYRAYRTAALANRNSAATAQARRAFMISDNERKKAWARYLAYDKQWQAGGRTGALEALQTKYPTTEALAASGKISAFDPQGGVEALTAKRTLDQNLINLTNSENMLNQQYTSSKSDYQAKIPQLARQLLSNYAGRGMAFSTGYSSAVGDQNADIARGLSNLDLQRQQQLADITSQRGLAQTGYKNDLATSVVGTVNRLAARAGTLGFGPKGRDIWNDPTLLAALAKKLLTVA
jgi:hypothetical protein